MSRLVKPGVLAICVVLITSLAATANDLVRLDPAGSGWRITGLDTGLAVSSAGPTDPQSADAVGASDAGAVAANDKQYVYDDQGRPLALLTGLVTLPSELSDGGIQVQPAAYLIDRSAKSPQLVVSWRAVQSAVEYRVSINGKKAVLVDGPPFKIDLVDVSLDDEIMIEALSGSRRPEESVIGTMSILVSEFTLSDAPTGVNAATFEQNTEAMAAVLPTSHRFQFTTFIPDDYVPLGWMEDAGCTPPLGTAPAGAAYFAGDNRSWSSTSTRYRTRITVHYYWDTGTKGYNRYVGPTRVYNSQKQLLGSKTAPISQITVGGPFTLSPTRFRFWFDHNSANPYCTFLSTIDFNNETYADRTAGYNGFFSHGSHDRAPNYEMYYSDNTTNYTLFRSWNRSGFHCLAICSTTSYSIVK